VYDLVDKGKEKEKLPEKGRGGLRERAIDRIDHQVDCLRKRKKPKKGAGERGGGGERANRSHRLPSLRRRAHGNSTAQEGREDKGEKKKKKSGERKKEKEYPFLLIFLSGNTALRLWERKSQRKSSAKRKEKWGIGGLTIPDSARTSSLHYRRNPARGGGGGGEEE